MEKAPLPEDPNVINDAYAMIGDAFKGAVGKHADALAQDYFDKLIAGEEAGHPLDTEAVRQQRPPVEPERAQIDLYEQSAKSLVGEISQLQAEFDQKVASGVLTTAEKQKLQAELDHQIQRRQNTLDVMARLHAHVGQQLAD